METLIVHPKANQTKVLIEILKAFDISFERKKATKSYSKEFEKVMDESISQAKKGKLTKVEMNEIWK